MKIIAQNKKALFDYEILDRIEAGIVLSGDEVKAAKAGHVNLTGSFATIKNNELFLLNAHISPYERAFQKKEEEATRSRKLLVSRRQLFNIMADISRKGITIVPLKMYANQRGLIKVEIALAKHKKPAGKKASLKEKDIKRETERQLKRYN